jgi:Ca-activated chloride channel family protein
MRGIQFRGQGKEWSVLFILGALAFLLFMVSAGAQTSRRRTVTNTNTRSKPAQQKPSPTPTRRTTAPVPTLDQLGEPPPARPTPTPKPMPTPIPPADDEKNYEVVRVTSNLVVVPVSVTDEKGQPVTGLQVSDFRLEEEGKPQEIAQIGDPEQVPLEIALLLDVSGSVDARFGFEKEAAARFLKQVLKPSDRAAVFSIGTEPKLVQPSANAEQAANGLMTVEPAKAATAFYDAVVMAAKYLAQNTPPQHRRVIVVITDGEDNYSDRIKAAIGATRAEQESVKPEDKLRIYNRVLTEVQREVQRADAAFYSINPSGESLRLNVISTRAEQGMEQLSQTTGGTSFVPERLEDLQGVFRQIASELRSQYLLQYYSQNESTNGTFLHIKVGVNARPALRVRARQGYYAKRK